LSKPTEHGDIWRGVLDKARPVIVISRDDTRGMRARATVAAVTSKIRGIHTEVPLDHSDGLDRACAINADELWTIDKSRLEHRVGRLRPEKLEALHEALRFALQLRSSSIL